MEARDIYQTHIDEVSRAVWEGDIDAVIARWGLPHTFETPGGDEEVGDEAMLRRYMENMHRHLKSIGATAYHRVCREVRFLPDRPDAIEGTHRTFILRGGSYVRDPYDADSVLELRDGVWRATLSRIPLLLREINPLRSTRPEEDSAPRPAAAEPTKRSDT